MADGQGKASEAVSYSSASLMAEVPRQVFDGETLVTQEGPGEEENPPEKPSEKPPEAEGKPEEKAEGEGKPPAEEEPPKFNPKHKTWEETERAREEAETRMHTATTETAREKEAREKAERENEELRQKLAEKEKPPEKPPESVKTPEELEAEQEAKIEQALDEIGQLDEFDPDYKKKVAKAWRKAGLGGSGQPATPNQQALEELIERKVTERLKAQQPEASPKPEASPAAKTTETEAEPGTQVWKEATELAIQAGLDLAEEDSTDAILFRAVAQKLPKEYDTKPLKEQVDWVVAEVRKRTGKAEITPEERERARKAQENNAVLERGSTRPAPAKKPGETDNNNGPYRSSDLLREVQEDRRIR